MAEFIDEVRSCEKNFELYSKNGGVKMGGRKIKDLDIGSNKGRKKLRAIEDTYILRRWRSPSIIEVINYHNVMRLIIFNTAIFFKFRVVNKRMQDFHEEFFTNDSLHVRIFSLIIIR